MSRENFNFPYESPYSSQLELMKDIYDTIENEKIGFFESPTGTGKTLTLLCGALSWLSNHQNSSDNNVKVSAISDGNNEPEWLRKVRQVNSNRSDGASELLTPTLINNKFKKTKVAKISTTMDGRISKLVNLLGNDDEEDTKEEDFLNLRDQNFGQKQVNPKIFYCSRTHSQLVQVISELKKTSFFTTASHPNSILELATSTASRANLCINKSVKNEFISSSVAINEACHDLLATENACPFYNRKKDAAFKEHLDILRSRKVLDIEDILKSGTSSQCCPYFSSRHLVPPASFVATPYNAILDKATREAYGIELAGSVVIFDEAHNIIDFIKQMNSLTIKAPKALFDRIIICIEEYLSKYGKRLSGANSSALSQLRIFFKKISEFLKLGVIGSFTVNDFAYRAQIDSFNFSRLLLHIEETKLFTKVFDETLLCEIPSIKCTLQALEKADSNGKFIISSEEFKYVCTDVIELMSEILEQCRAVIFCGGTMSPLADTIKQLLNVKLQTRVKSKSIGHVIEPENINISILTTGPSGTILNFSYDSRNNLKMIQELGIVISNYSRIIPAGLIVFFASFTYMEQVILNWRTQNNIFDEISRIKKIFIEKKGESSDAMLNEFEGVIKSKKGALIFAVMGGKLSEGINFADDMGRGVITIGLPYANINEIEIKEQVQAYVNLMRNFGDGKVKTFQELQSDYLDNSCMRVINQSIGRAIRHKNDYASIIIIDERANRNALVERLPIWISASLEEDRNGKFGNSFRSVSQFFKKRLNQS